MQIAFLICAVTGLIVLTVAASIIAGVIGMVARLIVKAFG